MLPRLIPGTVVFGWGRIGTLRSGDVVIIIHDGMEKIKRIDRMDGDKVFVVGDNTSASTDSRQFGWIERRLIKARVIWPRYI